MLTPLEGLVAATFTPFRDDGLVDHTAIAPMVDHLVANDIAGMYVLGSTGEGVSLTADERMAVAKTFVEAAAGRLPVIVQVGCESLAQAGELASHAQSVGADAISAVSPLYFKPDTAEMLVDSMAEIASAASDLPFYYYHIPAVTGVSVSMTDFLRLGGQQIPNLRGMKFTSTNVFEFQSCVEAAGGQYQMLWGLDEMLLFGLTAGARAAVGSTYNFAAPIYQQLRAAYAAGDLEQAKREQARSQALVRAFLPYGPRGAQKAIMSLIGQDCGPARLPVATLDDAQAAALRKDLERIGFFEWIE